MRLAADCTRPYFSLHPPPLSLPISHPHQTVQLPILLPVLSSLREKQYLEAAANQVSRQKSKLKKRRGL
jgi:hypothetical protein